MIKELIGILSGICVLTGASAQTSQSTQSTPKTKTASTSSTRNVLLTPSGFVSSLVSGRLNLEKSLVKDAAGNFNAVYFASSTGNPALINNQPQRVTLNSAGFEALFTKNETELSNWYPRLQEYIKQHELKMDKEQDWIKALNYYNSYH
ncbi:MAG TPA: hypothetical protein VG842_07305 [Sediminibacterium sp.]|nr:hypothetical protein [Sediminibacterium sp.]